MKVLPSAIVQDKNKIGTSGAWLILLDIHVADGVDIYLCSGDLNFEWTGAYGNGETYEAFPFILDPIKQNSKGEIPTLTLKVSNVTWLIHQYIDQYDGGTADSKVTIHVLATDDNTENFSELDVELAILSTVADAEWLTLTLGPPNPFRVPFPEFRYSSASCQWLFNSLECAYSTNFPSGEATVCDRTWKSCDALSNTSRFGGHRGLDTTGWYVL